MLYVIILCLEYMYNLLQKKKADNHINEVFFYI